MRSANIDLSSTKERFLANRDLPYHDFYYATAQTTTTSYVVGTNNMGQGKDQKKIFVSKSTLIMSTVDTVVHFNNSNNVAIVILANVWYEFKSNIYTVYHTQPADTAKIYFYFEGVLPKDTAYAEA